MLIRTAKNKDHPYVMLNKSFLEDPHLSFRAKGLLAFCMSKYDDWEFTISHLATVSTEGREAVSAGIKELIKQGYCVRKQLRDSNGKFGKSDYVMYESPQYIEEDLSPNPLTGNPQTGKPKAVLSKAAPYILPINDGTKYMESEKNSDSLSDPKGPDSPSSSSKKEDRFYAKKGRPQSCQEVKPEIKELTQFFIQKLQEINPKLRPPSIPRWEIQMRRIVEQDKREIGELKEVINFLLSDHIENYGSGKFTWSKAVSCPDKLRTHFHKLWGEMKQPNRSKKSEEKSAELLKEAREKISRENIAWFNHIHTKFKDKLDQKTTVSMRILGNNLLLNGTKGTAPVSCADPNFKILVEKFLTQERVT